MTLISRPALKKIFNFLAPHFPAAYRRYNIMEAQDVFALARNETEYTRRLEDFGSVKACLRNATGEFQTDKPYVEILGLRNGKREFDALIMEGIK